ncbi:hypothetical protein GCM10009582_18150 [Arthrobacter flavus]
MDRFSQLSNHRVLWAGTMGIILVRELQAPIGDSAPVLARLAPSANGHRIRGETPVAHHH